MTISMRKYEKTLGWIFLALTPLVLPMLLVSICELLPVQLDNAQLNGALFIVNFLLAVVIFHRFLWQSARHSLQHPGRTFCWMGIGFGVYFGGNTLVTMLVTSLAPDFANANDASILAMVQEHFWLMAICVVILVPITEEVLYRGLVFGTLRRKSRWAAYIVSVCAFSILHVISYIGTMPPLHLCLSFLQYLPAGIALALAYDKTDSVWTGILIHASNNLLAILTMR